MRYFNINSFIVGMMSVALLASCKKYADNPPVFEEYDSSSVNLDRRVLVIAIDGLNAEVFKSAATTNYTKMLDHAKFTWSSKSDVLSTDACSWKTLTSGVTYSKHQISDSTFAADLSNSGNFEDHEDATTTTYPSMFNQLMKTSMYSAPTMFVTPWSTLLTKALPEARSKVAVSDDLAAKDTLVSRIKTTDSKISIVHFNGPAKAGLSSSFSSSSASYMASLTTIDNYIGEIMDSLSKRSGYVTKEEWLVIVTGTHGGVNNAYGGGSDEETLVPTCYYNTKFKKLEFTKDGALNSVLFKGSSATNSALVNAVAPSSSVFNPGTGSAFTIQINIKGNKAPTYYPHFLSHTKNWTASNPTGTWSFFTNTNGVWCFSVKGTSERRLQAGANVFDNAWHTLTVVIYDTTVGGAAKRYIKRYTDAIRVDEGTTSRDITSIGDITTNLDLILGFGGDDNLYGGNASTAGLQFYANNIEIFNTALTDQEVSQNMCLQDITQHPKYANLKAFWSCTDGIGNTLLNTIDPSENFAINGSYSWDNLDDFPCSFPQNLAPGLKTKFLKNVDVGPQIFYWLGLSIPSTWQTEGTIWLDGYESEFIEI